jgi:hypothetical protein
MARGNCWNFSHNLCRSNPFNLPNSAENRAKLRGRDLPLLVETSRRLRGLPTPEDDEYSRSSGVTRSDQSNESGANVRTCRSCQKSINKGFDPLVSCSKCRRPYHEACRKPPLALEAEPYVHQPLFFKLFAYSCQELMDMLEMYQ